MEPDRATVIPLRAIQSTPDQKPQAELSGCWPRRLGFPAERTVQFNLTERSNPAHLGPRSALSRQRQAILPLDPLLEALPRLRVEGYEAISFSYGEPFHYPHLPELLAAAKAEGFRTSATTNGFRVVPRHLAIIKAIDRIAISFDGMGAVQNRIRGDVQAWDRAVAGLRYLAEIGKPAAAIYSVSQASIADIPDFVELCASLSVGSVVLRPLVGAGCARRGAAGLPLGQPELTSLWRTVQTLELVWQGEVAVQVDLAPAAVLAADDRLWDLALKGGEEQRLCDVVNPLVITPDAVLRPYTDDFPEEFDLGRLQDLSPERRVWITCGLPRLRKLLARTLHAAALEDGFVDWFAFQRDQARAPSTLPT
jgi:Fe-coproporphyrin III synthase